ncbi:fatty acyl-CoA reductase 1-like [Nylanderia fulva]|uniref:fatty acyl-CoA reductase 1-like n=1 Tax=Nylanderia fulva TaxID=613905 RepID=UPI0010FB2D1A|nr:fatty acyl-CoA reductase 1-like [Nylanderia fulva]
MNKGAANTFIPAFYAGRSILISGGTGFIGKALCEKLLRSCADVGEIFVLIRPKKGLNINERLKKMLDNKLFDVLRSERPSAFNKLIAIHGDVSLEGLGLQPIDREMLIERVSIIFHVAASVRFDESLREAVFNNTRSTRDICILAEKMKKLVVFLHVSSTYTQTDKPVVDETLYPSDLDWREVIKVAEHFDEHILKTFTAKYLGTMPNTYTFTKRLAEQVVSDYSKSLPCVIVRPSIVISTAFDPVKGSLDNFNGPVGMLVGGGKGILRVVFIDPIVTSDFMPVDVAIKTMLIVAWKRGIKTFTEDNTIHVYNCSGHDVKGINIKHLIELGFKLAEEVPLENIIWSPGITTTNSRLFYYLVVLIMHILPALFIDSILKLFRARPMLLKLQRKVYCANSALAFFLTHEWQFTNRKLQHFFDDLSPENNKDFGFDYRNFNIVHYFRNSVIGAKIYLLNEDMNHLNAAKLHRKRMLWLDRIVKILVGTLIMWIIYDKY